MSLSLYNIQDEYMHLADLIVANGGEVTDEIESALRINKESLENKAVNYGFICKEMEAAITTIDEEIDRLNSLKKSRTKTVSKLKDTLSAAMQIYGVEKIETPIMKISFRKTETTEIDNLDILDKRFLVEKVTITPDKKAIKEAIVNGENVVGARLQQNNLIQIK